MMRDTLTIDDIKAALFDRRWEVAEHYAPRAPGAHVERGAYFTLNPGRADRTVGSFVVWLEGPSAGRWRDFATGQHGDLIDLIALSLGCPLKDAVREARGFLGLASEAPEDVARRREAAERARRHAAEAQARLAEDRARASRAALALFLEARERIAGTPAEAYLRDSRGVDLARLGRQPRAIRFHPACRWQETDPATGEVQEARRPAMLALAVDGNGRPVACHRTYLEWHGGRWIKARVRQPKKVLGPFAGASIHLWRGIGPRGGAGRPLAEAEPGSRVYITEGIEDALSVATVLPEARVLAAISLGNLGRISLPSQIGEVVLVADNDEGASARAELDRAVAAHAKAGRRVRLWKARAGKDINDALRAARDRDDDAGGDEGAVLAPAPCEPEEVAHSSGPLIPAGGTTDN